MPDSDAPTPVALYGSAHRIAIVGRIRTIKPEFPQSESMGRISRDARLLFIMLWTVVDDAGRSRASSRMLASLLYPYDDDVPDLIEGWLLELEHEACIRRYVVDGHVYLEICKWLEHQKIDHASPSRLPDPREPSTNPRESSRILAPDLDLGSVPKEKDTPLPPKGESKRSPRKKKTDFNAKTVELPDWLPRGLWEDWCQDRQDRHKPLTLRASKLHLGELTDLHGRGHDSKLVIETAIKRNWMSFEFYAANAAKPNNVVPFRPADRVGTLGAGDID